MTVPSDRKEAAAVIRAGFQHNDPRGKAEDALAELLAVVERYENALRDVRQLCMDGHGDDLIAEVADTALAGTEESQ